MKQIIKKLTILGIIATLLIGSLNALDLMLLGNYDKEFVQNEGLENFVVSEKLDGVRAFWDGKNLYSRNGKPLNPPQWFIQGFPPFSIDGELWNKRDNFSQILSIISTDKDKSLWEELQFFVFDVPSEQIGLLHRLDTLKSFLTQNPNKYIKIIPQENISSFDELDLKLETLLQAKAEGLVIRHIHKPYIVGRSKFDLKLKPFSSDDCKIIGFTQGKGRFHSQVGSIICQKDDLTLKIGSGLSDDLRANPPQIGTIIEYKYNGTTSNNLPRFPVFLRIKE